MITPKELEDIAKHYKVYYQKSLDDADTIQAVEEIVKSIEDKILSGQLDLVEQKLLSQITLQLNQALVNPKGIKSKTLELSTNNQFHKNH